MCKTSLLHKFLVPTVLSALSLFILTTGNKPQPLSNPTQPSNSRQADLHNPADKVDQVTLSENYGKLPLSFEANRGQTDPRVKFLSRGTGYTLFLTGDGAVLSLRSGQSSLVNRQKGSAEVFSRSAGFPFRSKAADLNPKSALQGLETADSEPESALQGPETADSNPESALRGRNRTSNFQSQAPEVLRMKLVGANRAATVAALDKLPGKANYFIGNDPKNWHTNVPTYARVRYHDVYPGIDLVYYGNQGRLEYDFVVAPGADPKAIRLAVAGAIRESPLHIDGNGDLVVEAEGGEVQFQKPTVYQEQRPAASGRRSVPAGNRQLLDGRYVLTADNRIQFDIPKYDRNRPLVIDPVLVYSTYLGGSGNDQGNSVALDSSGNAYVTGLTYSANFPTAGALQSTNAGCDDIFVTKLNAGGTAIVYSTYLGSSGCDAARAIAVDSSGNAYVTGLTSSANFPVRNPIQPNYMGPFSGDYSDDAFALKLNAAGNALVYSTYLGGSGEDSGNAIAVDSAGNAYVAGSTGSMNFPLANAFQTTCTSCNNNRATTAFVAKINAAGSAFVYNTYLGGSGAEEGGSAIAVDSSGNAYVTGATNSTDFPTTSSAFQTVRKGSQNTFLTKFNATGSPVYSTYLGGSLFDSGLGVAVDSSGHAYVVGTTLDPDFPTTPGAYRTTTPSCPYTSTIQSACNQQAFVAEFNPSGSSLIYSTYLGSPSSTQGEFGAGWTWGRGIAVDTSGNAYVTGQTRATDFPTLDPIQASLKSQNGNAFVTKLNASGSALVYSTYLGGSGNDIGNGIAVDNSGFWSYEDAVVTGTTSSADFPTAHAIQPANAGATDAFVAKIRSHVVLSAFSPAVTISSNRTGFSAQGSFTLGSASNGINPLTDVVKLRVGNSYTTLPAGSFISGGSGSFRFQGTISRAAVQMQITRYSANSYQFNVAESGVNMSGSTNSVPIELVVGDDAGFTYVTPQFQ